MVSSCRRSDPYPSPAPEEETEARDSVITGIDIDPGGHPIRRIDLFIYDSGGTGQLEYHRRFDGLPETLDIITVEGEKDVAVIANSPRALSLAALSRHDAMSQLYYSFEDDDAEWPVMGAMARTEGNHVSISPEPLLCCIELAEISNNLDGYELLENPRVRLLGINSSARVMLQSGFYPEESIDYGEWHPLPYDIGLFTQYPGIRMYCYPNETPSDTFGTMHTSLELECTIMGKLHSFKVTLPPFGRNSHLMVGITVDGPGSFSSEVLTGDL